MAEEVQSFLCGGVNSKGPLQAASTVYLRKGTGEQQTPNQLFLQPHCKVGGLPAPVKGSPGF